MHKSINFYQFTVFIEPQKFIFSTLVAVSHTKDEKTT
jgi:hypothetical protein